MDVENARRLGRGAGNLDRPRQGDSLRFRTHTLARRHGVCAGETAWSGIVSRSPRSRFASSRPSRARVLCDRSDHQSRRRPASARAVQISGGSIAKPSNPRRAVKPRRRPLSRPSLSLQSVSRRELDPRSRPIASIGRAAAFAQPTRPRAWPASVWRIGTRARLACSRLASGTSRGRLNARRGQHWQADSSPGSPHNEWVVAAGRE